MSLHVAPVPAAQGCIALCPFKQQLLRHAHGSGEPQNLWRIFPHANMSMMETKGPVHLSLAVLWLHPAAFPAHGLAFTSLQDLNLDSPREQDQAQNWLLVFGGPAQLGSLWASSPPRALTLSPALPAWSCQRLGSICQHLGAIGCAG